MNRPADYYDLIVTGDLGLLGLSLATELFVQKGVINPNYSDCGVLLYDGIQGINAGGSGCGSSACMLCGPLLKKMMAGEIKRLLLVGTGALMSPISSFQGESIPGIAHAVAIEMS
jgi:stage V sporulation protein AD